MKKEKSNMTHNVHEHNHMDKGSAIAGNNLGNYKPLIIIPIFCFF